MKLNLTKTGVVASSAAGLAAARAAFAGTGTPVVPSVRDLGVDDARGSAVPSSKRIGSPGFPPDFRSQVAAGLVVAGAAWGSAVDGLTSSAARELRSVVHRALTRGVGSRRAVEVDLAFHGPPHRLDPAEAAVTTTLTSWVKWVPGWAGPADRLETSWAAERGRTRARRRGPMTATLAALRRLGREAHGPLDWVTADGQAAPVDDPVALRAAVHADFRRREWTVAAARRADLRGADRGVDEALTGEPCRRLLRRGRARQVGRLRCVMAGGTWPQARLAAAGMAETAECPRCGIEPETVLHRWWRCPALDMARHQAEVGELALKSRCGAVMRWPGARFQVWVGESWRPGRMAPRCIPEFGSSTRPGGVSGFPVLRAGSWPSRSAARSRLRSGLRCEPW